MKARLIRSDKLVFDEGGGIRQIRIWLVPEPVPPAAHRFKDSLVHVVDGVRVIGFDHERGKGDHLHLRGVETPYDFRSVAELLADFRMLVRRERRMRMAGALVFRIGASLETIDNEIVADVEAAVAAAEAGQDFVAKRTIRFETWSAFFRTMTPNRIAILEHVAARELVASTRALSIALRRDYSGVHADVAALLKLGLLERDGNALRCEVEPGGSELVAA